MKNIQIMTNTLFAVGCALLIGTKSFAEPANIDQLKQELLTYQSSGQYDKDIAQVIADAETYMAGRVAENKKATPPQKLAMVFDIDETSLSNYKNIAANNFCYSKDQSIKDIARANDPVIAPTLMLYQDAVKNGIAVFFITGRGDSLNKETISNLKAAGYEGWAGLFFRPKTDTQPSASPFKTQARAAIEQAGYTIIASVGDQDSDFTGGHAEKTFKLPNPFYYIP